VELFSRVEGSARVGNWKDLGECQVAIVKLNDAEKQYYSGCLELHLADVAWDKFKSVFQDIHTDQYHFMKLQTARQGRSEAPKNLQTGARFCGRK
jgi:hypothetical protein